MCRTLATFAMEIEEVGEGVRVEGMTEGRSRNEIGLFCESGLCAWVLVAVCECVRVCAKCDAAEEKGKKKGCEMERRTTRKKPS